MLSTDVLSMLAAVVVVESDGVEERDFTHKVLKTQQIAESGSIVSRELTEQETEIKNSTLSKSPLDSLSP